MLVSIIVPCYNEQETIPVFYEEVNKIIKQVKGHSFEYVFVNDGSKDNTRQEVLKLREKDKHVSFVDFSRNFGKEAGLLAGLRHAKGDAVIVMDVDLQDPPSLIPDMVAGVEEGYDVVYTKRKDRKGEPLIRSAFSKMFYKIMNIISEVEVVDGARDYRIMTRRVVDSILELTERQRFSKGLFMWVGYDSKVIEFDHVDRSLGDTKWSFFKLVTYAIEGIVSFSDVPLKLAGWLGAVFSGFSFLLLLYILIKNLIFKNPVDGWASTISIIVFFAGIQLIVLGIIGEYLARIYGEVKQRPVYVVKDYLESEIEDKS